MADFNRLKDRFNTYIVKEKTWWSRYGLSLFFLIISLHVVDFIKDLEGAQIYSLVLGATVLSAIHGGLWPAVIVSLLGALALDYYFIEPLNNIFDSANSLLRFLLYSISATLFAFIINVLKSSLIESENLKNIAERANVTKDNLMAVVAHDLRNPIGVIMGFSEVLKNKINDEDLLKNIEIIEKNASASLELINDLQDLASIESLDYKLDISRFDLLELIEEMKISLSHQANRKGISVQVSEIGNNFFIRADKRQMRRVFQNLIDNAIKYSPMGSRVYIEVEEDNSALTVVIKDQGLGIAASEQEKIFTPFYRSPTKPTAGESSTGLGLATVSAIVKAHKAKIKLISEVGRGSTFIVEFNRS